MKKRLFLTILMAVLLVSVFTVAGATVTLNETVTCFDGQSTIRWTSDSVPQGGFIVIVEAINPLGSTSLLQMAGQTTQNSLVTGILTPERTYRVYIVDSDYNILDSHDYVMPAVSDFQDGKLTTKSVKVTIETRQANADGKYKRVSSFNAKDMNAIASDGTAFSCMKYQMRMPQLAYERNFYVQLVFESPNGYTYTEISKEVTFERVNDGYQTLWWDYAGVDFFDALYRQTGSIPSGQYKIYLYWDGYYVNTMPFNVN